MSDGIHALALNEHVTESRGIGRHTLHDRRSRAHPAARAAVTLDAGDRAAGTSLRANTRPGRHSTIQGR